VHFLDRFNYDGRTVWLVSIVFGLCLLSHAAKKILGYGSASLRCINEFCDAALDTVSRTKANAASALKSADLVLTANFI